MYTVQILLDTTGGKRTGSTDSVARSQPWVPDYTVKATTDVLFLKIRFTANIYFAKVFKGGGFIFYVHKKIYYLY